MWAGNFYMVRLICGNFRQICIYKPTFVIYDKIHPEHINFYFLTCHRQILTACPPKY